METETIKNDILEIKKLIDQEKYADALLLCNKYPNNIKTINLKISIYVAQKKLEQALRLCNKFENEYTIQIRKASILLKMNEYDELQNFCSKYKENKILNLYKAKALINLGKYEEAIKACNEVPNNANVQERKVIALEKLGRIKEAMEICNSEQFKSDERFIKKYEELSKKYQIGNRHSQGCEILTRIYDNTITKELIEQSELNKYMKTIFLIAYYEKYNKKAGIQFVKEQKKSTTDGYLLKILNKLYDRLISKKTLFDISLYSTLTCCEIDFSKVTSQKETKEEKNTIETMPIEKGDNMEIQIPLKKQKKESKIISVQGKKVDHRASTTSKTKIINVPQKQEEQNETNILIKDVFDKELLEIGKYIYVQMNSRRQKDAVKAWDRLESLSYEPITNKKAVEKIIHLIYVHASYTDSMELNEKKYAKYL